MIDSGQDKEEMDPGLIYRAGCLLNKQPVYIEVFLHAFSSQKPKLQLNKVYFHPKWFQHDQNPKCEYF